MSTIASTIDAVHRAATRKAMHRLIPLMCAIYFMSFLDRTNVALAKVQLAADVGISAAAYGLGSGIFFIGYALLEVPSNLVAYRVGVRRWIARIAVTWGLLSTAMMFVQGEWSFYALRVLLGIAEAGLFPALMYMVTLWFAPADRPVAVGWIYTAPALALMLGNPIGGALMQLGGIGGAARLAMDVHDRRDSQRACRHPALLLAARAAARRALALRCRSAGIGRPRGDGP